MCSVVGGNVGDKFRVHLQYFFILEIWRSIAPSPCGFFLPTKEDHSHIHKCWRTCSREEEDNRARRDFADLSNGGWYALGLVVQEAEKPTGINMTLMDRK